MATVYRARDLRNQRAVAIKVLRPEFAAAVGTERFLREIKIAAQLIHPHILPLHDSGEAGGYLYYVMPAVSGGSLRDRLNRESPLPLDQALRVAQSLATALDYAHRQSVVHRDIKPENVMLQDGEAMIADFGIARALNRTEAEPITETGFSIGTPAYMSPEQVSGDRALDGRSDIYALGCVLYEMLAGEPPFTGPNIRAVMARQITDPAPPLSTIRPDVPPQVCHALARALAKEPADRFASAADFGSALSGPGPATGPAQGLVVLPFVNLSSDPDNEYFSDGLTEELIADLSKIRALRVISRTSAMQLKGTAKDLRTLGRELKVRYALEGSVRKAGQSLRITAQLIDTTNDTHLWVEKYSGQMDDVFDIQERVSRSIAEALRLALSPSETRAIAVRPIPDVRAYECYIRAHHEMWHWTDEAVSRALQYLREAQAIVGDNISLLAGMAEAHLMRTLTDIGNAPVHMKGVEQCAKKILEIDPNSSHGFCFLGCARWQQPGGFAEGVKHMKHAFDLNPNDVQNMQWLALCAAEAGKPLVADACTRRLQEIDPLSSTTHLMLGWARFLDGRADQALEPLARARQLDSTSPLTGMTYGIVLAVNQRMDEADAVFEKILRDSPGNFYSWCGDFYRHALKGDRDRALKVVTPSLEATAEADSSVSLCLADCYALIGETERAVFWLSNAVARGYTNYPFLSRQDPFLQSIRTDGGFQQLMARTKQEWERLEL